MDKKIILITGASSGIGRVTALELAKQGHRLIIHGRNEKKTTAVKDEIMAITGNQDIEAMTANLSLMVEVKAFADKVKAKYDHLDVLINNAGGQFGNTREVTAEGYEKTFAINTLAPFLLTRLLMPLLQESVSARVVTVASESYRQGGKIDLNDIAFEKRYSLIRSYGLSKRYVWFLMREFDRRLQNDNIHNITVNTCEPGSAVTDLQRVSGNTMLMRILTILWRPMMWSVEKAAATSIFLATSEKVDKVSGRFFGNCKEKKIAAKWIDADVQQRIWDFCEAACKDYLQ